MTPKIYYEKRIDTYNAALKHSKRKSSMFLYGKLLFFALAISSCVVWIYYSKNSFVWGYGTISLIIYLILMYLDGKEMDRQRLIQKLITVLSNEIRNLSGAFTNDNGAKYISSNHPYTFDIDIFGESSLFHRINRTITPEGSDRLAQILSNVGTDKDTILQRQAAIAELEELNDFRLLFQCIGRINAPLDARAITAESTHLNTTILKWIIRTSWGITAVSILFIIISSFLNIPIRIGVMTLMGAISINGVMSVFCFHRSGKIMSRIDSLIRFARQYSPIMELCSAQRFDSVLLNHIQTVFLEQQRSISKLRSMHELLRFRNNPILWILANSLALLDLYMVLQFSLWKKHYLPELPRLLMEIGHLDALVSLSNYNFNHPNTTIPQFTDSGIKVQNISHPFITTSDVVGNDYIQEEDSISIITGANMSGKSTFLRTIALNMVLANAGCKVFAGMFSFNPQLRLFTSMRTQDNVAIGQSYFNAEIDRLAQAIDYNTAHTPTLFILDEVLKGTNSEDKLQGTLELLEFFSKRGFTAMIATHDIGVTSLEKKYGDLRFKNYCFEIELSDPITYTYKINRGICQNRNASYILSRMLADKE